MIADSKQSARFINRQEEIELIRDKLGTLKNNKWLFNFILMVSGIPGIGKSALIDKAAKEAKILGIASIQLDYEAAEAKNDLIYLLQGVANHLFKRSPTWLKALKEYREQEDNYSLERLITVFTENLRTQLTQAPLLLLIDNSHYMNDSAQKKSTCAVGFFGSFRLRRKNSGFGC